MKKGTVTRRKRPLALMLGVLFVFSAVCGAGSVLPAGVKDALPEAVRETVNPITVQASSTDKAMVMGTDAVLGHDDDYNSTKANTQVVWYNEKSWYVIGYNGNGAAALSRNMTLFATGILKDNMQFNPDSKLINEYSGSILKTQVENIASGFTDGEKAAITPKELTGGSGNYGSTSPAYNEDHIAGSGVSNALLWPLSVKEANEITQQELREVSDFWWLRSPGDRVSFAAGVNYDGFVDRYGDHVYRPFGVRPAFHVNLQSVLFTSAAEGGKSSGTVGADALTSVGTNTGNEWKLTLKDSAHSSFAASTTSYDSSTGVLTFTYSDAVLTADNDFVSIIVTDSNNTIKYYGRVVSKTTASGNSATVNLSRKINTGDKVYAFNEQVNEDKKTDYASDVQALQLATPTIAYTVKFQGNGADGGSMTDQNRTVGDGKALDENKFSLTGYTFTGWNTQADGKGTSYTDKATGDLSTTAGDITLYAQWAPISYTVRFNNNGGSGTMSDQSRKYDDGLELTGNTFTNGTFPFTGWNTKPDGTGDAYADKATGNLTEADGATVTLYAMWKPSQETKTDVKGFTAADIPQTLKDAGFDTPEKIKEALLKVVVSKGGAGAQGAEGSGHVLLEVKLMVSTDGGASWTEATQQNFPAGGVKAVLPYPAGTGKDTHIFTVVHMFTEDFRGHKPGETETPAVTLTDKGIEVVLDGLSPVLLSWEKKQTTPAPAPAPTPTPAPTPVPAPVPVTENAPANLTHVNAPQTAETASQTAILWISALALLLSVTAVCRKRRKP